MPEFPGGEQALLHYLAEQTSVYASSHEQEYLRVRVIVEKEGEITPVSYTHLTLPTT